MNDDLAKLKADADARMRQQMAVALRVGLEALSMRLLMVLALLLNTGIFAWCLWTPTWERLVAACVFAVVSYCLVHVKPKSGD